MNISRYVRPKSPIVTATSYLQNSLVRTTRSLHPAVLANSTCTTRRTSTNTPVIAMAPRKPKATTLDPQQSESSTFRSTPDSSAPSPAHNLRRSGRNHHPQSASEKDRIIEARSEIFGRMMGRDDSGQGLRNDKDQEEGVKMAIEGLARMERRLQRATKRQKKALEDDGIPVPSAVTRSNAPYHPRPISIDDAKKEAKEPMLKFHLNESDGEAEYKPATEQDGNVKMEAAATNIVEPDDSPDAPERGAARAPPVNSSYLPLPWKGRLGYVSTSLNPKEIRSNSV